MRVKIFWLFLCFEILLSCNNTQTANSVITDSANKEKTSLSFTGEYCYSYIKDKDSVMLRIVVADSNVTGKLRYNFFEKDNNDGVINGILKKDTVFADYNFVSEGKQSVRQVAFLLTDSSANEGYGEVHQQGDTMIFTDQHALSFKNSLTLIKKECD